MTTLEGRSGDPDLGVVSGLQLPTIQPLTARSVVLSTLLGYHPPALPVSALVRVGVLFGIADSATRAALSRLVAVGDLTADDGVYRLTERLVRRQTAQDDSASLQSRQWTGQWEMAVVITAVLVTMTIVVSCQKQEPNGTESGTSAADAPIMIGPALFDLSLIHI